jgi:hypothetical protein
MDSGVRQRGLFTEFSDTREMDEEVLVDSDDAQASNSYGKNMFANKYDRLEIGNIDADIIAITEDEESDAISVVPEMRDDSERFASQSCEKASAKELMAMLQLQQFRCALSGDRLTPDVSRCDHVIPVSEGGSNRIDNLQWVTHDINRAKGVMSQDAFIGMCIKVAIWAQREP